MSVRVQIGDCRQALAAMEANSVHCCVTSPPFFRLRQYTVSPLEIGQEIDPEEYIDALVETFAMVRRVLDAEGSLWLQLGDTYASGGNGGGGALVAKRRQWTGAHERKGWRRRAQGFKDKDLMSVPSAVVHALVADGWYHRQTIIWDKVVATEPPRRDRPSASHEYLFLLTKSAASRVRDPGEIWFHTSVWRFRPGRSAVDHPALMPAELVRRCIVSSTSPGHVVLDPFAGAGTTGLVSDQLQRDAILLELNADFASLALDRIRLDAGMLGDVA